MNLSAPVSKIPYVTPAYEERLRRLGLKTVRDLLFYFPNRYDDFSNLKRVADLEEGETATVRGKIAGVKNIRTWKKKMNITEIVVGDGSGFIRAVWFNQPFLTKTFKAGDFIHLSGKIGSQKSELFFPHPAYELPRGGGETKHTGRLVPVYAETDGLSSRWLRFIIKPLLRFAKDVPEYLPLDLKIRRNFPDLTPALQEIHFPENAASAESARGRFAFEELFFLQLRALSARQKLKQEAAKTVPLNLEAVKEFVSFLPFRLTDAQRKAAWEILKDLEKTSPMNRLLNGDVGSGKTVVAALAAFNCALAGNQAAFMAPTEILANQHFQEISKLFKKFKKIKIALLAAKSAKIGGKEIKKSDLLGKISEGKINVLVGTHSLIQKSVKFKNLAFAVVDEQHRFGVNQRAELGRGGVFSPHFLSMSATPIPRTLALTAFGDLDISVLDELPKGRQKITTKIVPPEERAAAYAFIESEIKNGRQAFVICPRIEINKEGELQNNGSAKKRLWAEVKAVKDEHKKLSEKIFPDLKIGMLHGKLKSEEKEKILSDFKSKKIDVLVATSVVEVGIDVPNATVMMIEDADRFGLAQLHQFRGRVGRGESKSRCFLFSGSSAENNRRLKAMENCDSGFELARKDLEIRGPGSLLSGRQWGIPDLAMASLSDLNLVKEARGEAENLLKEDPFLKNRPLLREKIADFSKSIHLE